MLRCFKTSRGFIRVSVLKECRLGLMSCNTNFHTTSAAQKDREGATEKLKSNYLELLNQYFENSEFKFRNENGREVLKKWMKDIYLRSKVLIALDVEAWEKNSNKVIEIGLAVYNPAEQAGSIFPNIRQVHIVVSEHQRMFNGKYCPNNKDKFMGGSSHVLTLRESSKFLQMIFSEYAKRESDTVLVGHHILGDIKWLRQIGVKISDEIDVIDTEKLYGLSFESGGSLRGILRAVDIPHGYLHNAANDAYYTLLAAFAYCDPSIRKIKELDVFTPHIPAKISPAEKKTQKFKDRFHDKAKYIARHSGVELYSDLFGEELSKSDSS